MKNYFKFYSLLIISLVLIGCNNAEQLNVFGYESEDGNKVNITTGDQASLEVIINYFCLLYTSPSPRDTMSSRMPSSA